MACSGDHAKIYPRRDILEALRVFVGLSPSDVRMLRDDASQSPYRRAQESEPGMWCKRVEVQENETSEMEKVIIAVSSTVSRACPSHYLPLSPCLQSRVWQIGHRPCRCWFTPSIRAACMDGINRHRHGRYVIGRTVWQFMCLTCQCLITSLPPACVYLSALPVCLPEEEGDWIE